MLETPTKVEQAEMKSEADLFDPMTGKPLVRYDPKTGDPIHAAHTGFLPPMPAWGYLGTHVGWALFNVLCAFLASTSTQSNATAANVTVTAVFFWAIGASVIALVSFFYRKRHQLP